MIFDSVIVKETLFVLLTIVVLFVDIGCNHNNTANNNTSIEPEQVQNQIHSKGTEVDPAQIDEISQLEELYYILNKCIQMHLECEEKYTTFIKTINKYDINDTRYDEICYKFCNTYQYPTCASKHTKSIINRYLDYKFNIDRSKQQNNFCLLVTFRVNEHYQDTPELCFDYNSLCERIGGNEKLCDEFRYEVESDKWYCLITDEDN